MRTITNRYIYLFNITKIMKRFLIIVGVLLLLFIGILIAIPYFFKDKIAALIKEKANKELYATLDFYDVDISLLRKFPNVNLRIEGLNITNRAPFAGDTLFSSKYVEINADIVAYLREDLLKIVSLHFEQPSVYAHVLPDSSANWRIVTPSPSPSTTPKSVEPKSSSAMRIALQQYRISEGRVVYYAEEADRIISLTHLNHEGSGDFAKEMFTLITKTSADVSFIQGGVPWLKDAKTELNLNVVVDMLNNKYTLTDNELHLNALRASFEGFVVMPGSSNDIEVDMRFSTKNNEFKNLMSLVPAVYSHQFQEIKSAGTASIQGAVKGIYNDSLLPGFELHVLAERGFIQYPKLPGALQDVYLDLTLQSPGGNSLDALVIMLKRLSLSFAGDPLQMALEVRTPISDPFIRANVNGKINLANIKNLVPSEQLGDKQISGMINVDFSCKGSMSAVKQRRLQDFEASGQISANAVEFYKPDIPERIGIPQATLAFSSYNATLRDCNITLGKSSLLLDGALDNIIGYVVADNTLKGALNLRSPYFDCNPWLKDSAAAKTAQPGDTVWSSVEIPGNIDFTFTGALKELRYTNLQLNDAQGKLIVRDKILRLENVGAKLLGGSVVMNGTYNTQNVQRPTTSFDMKVTAMEFAKAAEGFTSIQQFAPFTKFLKGNFGANIALTSDLDGHLQPVWDSFNSQGGLSITNLKIEDFKPLNQVADLLNFDVLRNPTLLKANPYYEIKNGRLYIKPFSVTLGGNTIMMSGSNGLDKSIDYTITANIPANKIPAGMIASIPALGEMAEKLKSKPIPVTIKISGTIDNPIIQPSLSGVQDAASQALDAVQEEAKRRAQEEIDKAKQKANEELEKRKKEAEQKVKEEADKKAKEILKDKTPSFLKNLLQKDTTKK